MSDKHTEVMNEVLALTRYLRIGLSQSPIKKDCFDWENDCNFKAKPVRDKIFGMWCLMHIFD
jgi:hypothetical protein